MASEKKREPKTPPSMGGEARAARLSPEQRTKIASDAAIVRWSKEGKITPIAAIYGTVDRPLRIGGVEIPCYVLADGTRVLVQRGLQSGIGLSEAGGAKHPQRLVALMNSFLDKGIDIRNLTSRIKNPIKFIPPSGGVAYGYEATILPDICAVVIDATRLGKLRKTQAKLARQCAALQHGFATIGIIALVDEATGYQRFRAKDALAEILEKFISKELRPWVKTFPLVYYQEVFKLNKWEFDPAKGCPSVLGHWTNNIIYRRLAPGVLDELRRLTPRTESGKLKHRLFQHLTDDLGHPKLRTHLEGVIMLMKYACDWRQFMDRLDVEYPQYGSTLMLPFPKDYNPPDPEI